MDQRKGNDDWTGLKDITLVLCRPALGAPSVHRKCVTTTFSKKAGLQEK